MDYHSVLLDGRVVAPADADASSAPTCTASRGSLLTGLYPWQLEEGCQLWGLLPQKYRTYPDMLEEAGYFVGLTNKGWGPGSVEASGSTRNPAGPSFDEFRCEPLTSCMNSNDYAANFGAFLEQKPDHQPFCFWYGAKEPHRKYEKESGLKHGKGQLRFVLDRDSTVPNWTDAQQLWGDLERFLGRGERPRYGRLTYWAKFEYFAVFWGMFVIGGTGLILYAMLFGYR